jgi:tetratricopeptide (TPR) repeat protein
MVASAGGDYDRAIDLYTQVTQRQPLPQYVIALGDTYAAAGRGADAQRQYDLVGAIDQLYRANGINTDLQMALYFADHGDPAEALRQAQAVHDLQPDNIYTADALSWALYRNARSSEAATYSEAALRLGTQDPLLLFHSGMIRFSLGDRDGARDLLGRAIALNPRFSLLHAGEAAGTLAQLGGKNGG